MEISREAVLEIPQADEIQKVSGVIEDYELVEGMIVQLERVGFARIKKIRNNGPIMMSWLHR